MAESPLIIPAGFNDWPRGKQVEHTLLTVYGFSLFTHSMTNRCRKKIVVKSPG
jgi:hypothetical protein